LRNWCNIPISVATKTRSLVVFLASSSMPPVERMCVLFPGISPDSAIHSALVVHPHSGWTYSSAPSLARTVSTNALGEISARSEEHTSELQSRFDLVCRLLLEKKNTVGIVLCFASGRWLVSI